MPNETQRQVKTETDFDRTDPRSYPFMVRDVLRWGDTDAIGHINNVNFTRFFEGSRIAFLSAVDAGGRNADAFMLAHTWIDFRAQMHYPGEIRTGSRVTDIGTSSVRIAHAIFQGEICAAVGDAVVVMVDAQSGRPCRVPDNVRARLRDPAL